MKKQSPFMKNAGLRLKNRKWLDYSFNIARRILAALGDNDGMTQKALAKSIKVTPQYINKVVKGNENLSLETIAKLSGALGIELISFTDYKDDYIKLGGLSMEQAPMPSFETIYRDNAAVQVTITEVSNNNAAVVFSLAEVKNVCTREKDYIRLIK